MAGSSAPWVSLRLVVAVVMGAPWIICLSMWFVLSGTFAGDETPFPWLFLAVVAALGVVVGLVITVIGYRAAPLPTGLPAAEAAARARTAYTSRLFLRMALAEIPLLVSMALAFVTSRDGFYVVLLGAVVSVVLMLVHVWPTERSVDRVADSLERGGTRSYLREALALPPR